MPGEEVIVPTVTFIAPINAINYLGAHPVFMDADKFYNLDVEKTVDFLRKETTVSSGVIINKRSGRRIAAVLPVHIFGNPVQLDPLLTVCAEFNIPIIEDATESLGTRYNNSGQAQANKHTGSLGLFGCLSFNGNKIITTGGGGMILTDNEDLAKRAKHLTTQAKQDGLRYVHDEVGYNYRLTNILAAIGVAQLERLNTYLLRKKENYEHYRSLLNGCAGLSLASTPDYGTSNLWMYALQIDKDLYGKDWEEMIKIFTSEKIETRPLWHLNHLQAPYRDCQSYRIEKAPVLLAQTLNIPCSVSLRLEEIEKVVSILYLSKT
jgi:dTDP-4-amino-4,6-dideoxygalactose transaminase